MAWLLVHAHCHGGPLNRHHTLEDLEAVVRVGGAAGADAAQQPDGGQLPGCVSTHVVVAAAGEEPAASSTKKGVPVLGLRGAKSVVRLPEAISPPQGRFNGGQSAAMVKNIMLDF